MPPQLSNHGKSGKTWPKCDRGIGKIEAQINYLKENRCISSSRLRLVDPWCSQFVFCNVKIKVCDIHAFDFCQRNLCNKEEDSMGASYYRNSDVHKALATCSL